MPPIKDRTNPIFLTFANVDVRLSDQQMGMQMTDKTFDN